MLHLTGSCWSSVAQRVFIYAHYGHNDCNNNNNNTHASALHRTTMTVASDTCYNINRGGCGGAAVVVPDLHAPTGCSHHRNFEQRNRRSGLVGFLIIISFPPFAVQSMVVSCAGVVRGRGRPDARTHTPTEVTERRAVVLMFSPWRSRLLFGRI